MKNKHYTLMRIRLAMCLLVCFLTSIPTWAYDFELNGVYYNITDANAQTVEVTYVERSTGNRDFYYGAITIPKRVSKENVTYSVTSIGEYAFYYCSGLTSITIPNSVTSIGDRAFEYCSGLTAVHISDLAAWCNISFYRDSNPLYYAHHLYMNGQEITNLVIPNGVTSIGYSAFDGCSSLTSIKIPNSVTTIESAAFSGCSSLTSINIPNSVTSIWSSAFSNCSGLTSVIIGNSVTSIESQAFYGCSSLTSITIPDCVTSIGYEAFRGCSSLTSITIPNSVTSIGVDAFVGTSWYNNQPDGLAYAGKLAYKFKGTMLDNTKIVLEEGTLGISSGAFEGCSGLTSITIPNSVTSIEGGAFSGCSGLTSITIPDGVTSIGHEAFRGCSSLTSITIPNSVTSIEGGAFIGCSGLTSITIPNSVTSIESQAFFGCSGLTSITIPNSVTSIADAAFYNCSSLTSITIGNSVTSIGRSAFQNCSSLTSVNITDLSAWCNISFSYIDSNPLIYAHHLYKNGKKITNLDIPNNVTSIGDFAFFGCSGLTSVTIPNSVTSIGNYTFNGCSSLTSVTVDWYTPLEIGDYFNVFPDSYNHNVTLYVPKGTKALYEAADVWKYFGNIAEIGEITIGDNGIGTYCSTQALDFSGTDEIKAYIVSAFKPSTGEVTLTRITDVPANTGIVVKGAAGTYSIPMGPGETIVSNMLRGVTTNTVLNKVEGDYTNYVLAKKNGNLGFYAVVDGSTLSAGKAYLPLPTASLPSSARSIKLIFEDDGTTGVSDASRLNDKGEMINDHIYDLQGRRVEKPTRGFYIVNGRKVVIK